MALHNKRERKVLREHYVYICAAQHIIIIMHVPDPEGIATKRTAEYYVLVRSYTCTHS